MSIVDYTEIKHSMDWELFAQAFFRAKGFEIVEGPSIGSDSGTGKDLIIEEVKPSEFGEMKRRFLVSCKHYAHREKGNSVKESDEKGSISVNLELENCDGFIGFYSTYPTSTLLDNLNKLKEKKKQIVEIFDSEKIEHYLLYENKENDLLKRFFPTSYTNWKRLSKKEIEQNPNFKKLLEENFKIKDKDYFKKYYEGQPADWSIIRKYTFKRDSFDYIVQQLETNRISLLTGAGGEGKTTLLMQIGEYYLQKKYQVFYSFDSIHNIDLTELKFKPGSTYLLIIDNANTIRNLSEFIKKIKLSNGVSLLLSSRRNEWNYSLSLRTDNEDMCRWIGKVNNLHRLSDNELGRLLELLQKHNVLNEEVKNKLTTFINDNTNYNFLLSIMVYATQGKSFNFIIEDVIRKIQGWKDSELTVRAVGYIVCIEILGKGPHGIVYCPETLLKTLLRITDINQYRTIKKYLAEEAFFQGSLKNIIHTRNPIIAKIYFDSLFKIGTGLLDKYEFYYNIIREASLSNKNYDKDILALVPKYFLDKDEKLAIQLVKDAISCGFFWNTYYPFIDNEISKGNIGSYNSEEYSARWLFEKAFKNNWKERGLYVRWALLELKHGDIGSIDMEYTPRWIFYKGMKLAPNDNLFIVWANEEARINNFGKDIHEEFSARWICNEGIHKFPTGNFFLTWANIEIKAGNIGKDVNEEYSARWVFNEGTKKIPKEDLLSTWATVEFNERNIGESIDEQYTARWICKLGIDKTPTSRMYATWANIEASAGNIGTSVNNEYSARWICNEGISKAPNGPLFATWANIEAEAGNIGTSVNDEYSARWVCKEGISKAPAHDLFCAWANIEVNAGNIGASVKDEYSARWICIEGTGKTPHSSLFIKWANIEADAGNIGMDVKDEYSARWILLEGFGKIKSPFILLRWLGIELNEQNMGNKDTPFTAEWLFEVYNKNFGPLIINGKKILNVRELKEFLDERAIDDSNSSDLILGLTD